MQCTRTTYSIFLTFFIASVIEIVVVLNTQRRRSMMKKRNEIELLPNTPYNHAAGSDFSLNSITDQPCQWLECNIGILGQIPFPTPQTTLKHIKKITLPYSSLTVISFQCSNEYQYQPPTHTDSSIASSNKSWKSWNMLIHGSGNSHQCHWLEDKALSETIQKLQPRKTRRINK